jgi:hypothetical protein
MSDTTGDRAYARDARRQSLLTWAAMIVFFAGCASLTAAVVFLNIDRFTSSVLGVVGVVMLPTGAAFVWRLGNLRGVR